MISFIIKGNDQKLKNYFWSPFQVKYPACQYLFTNEVQFESTAKKANHSTLFVTDVDSVPTYETMVLLENIGGKNEVLLPKWFDGYGSPTKDLNSFSVLKENFVSAGYNLKECIEKNSPTVHKKGSMYYVG